jgi:competence protein ComEC
MSAKFARRLKQAVGMPDRLWKYVGSTILTTCVAQLGVLPLLALQFGGVSLAAVPANLLGIPLASGGLVCGFCALVLAAVFPWAAGCAFDLTWLLLRLCNLVASLASSMPRAVLELSRPHPAEVVVFLTCFFAALSLAAGIGRRSSKRHRAALFLTISCAAVLLGRFVGLVPAKLPAGRGTGDAPSLTVDFLDVGQGDAALMRFQDGGCVLVDAGEAREGWDSGQKVLAPFLRAVGLQSVDVAVVSHFHSDHAGGLMWLVEKEMVDRVVSAAADTSSCLRKLLERACRKHRITLDTAVRSGKALGGAAGVSRHGRVHRFTSAPHRMRHSRHFVLFAQRLVPRLCPGTDVQFILTGDVGARVLDALAGRLAKRTALGPGSVVRREGAPSRRPRR